MDLYTFLKSLPKVSLHVHLAGMVQPSTLVELASKNGMALPAYREPADLLNGIDGSWLDDPTKRRWRREWSREIDALIAQLD